ncbi:Mrx15p Ecym_2519 [Eremothecium cymbalariae DBVPG|uniref:Uncharacterized protein n=1 Tax=Eremothecium cymbalariae (strain CBS 270.75 / DBVPG 7215 / KCTC 17166 / NRRL Y-17582) TaxID=931890 RepID=G8JQ82_ERECY|nr:Hypothetical protein Ecym_2519 [Eremothecium cymbalariae DBVPG\
MSLKFSAKLATLIGKTAPEEIYSYKPGRLLRIGPWFLFATFFGYGISFADWSLSTSFKLYKEKEELGNDNQDHDVPWYASDRLSFFGRITASVLLSSIPFALCISALYFPSRVVTKIRYIPGMKPQCQLTRNALFGGDVTYVAPLKSIRRGPRTRVYTGVGEQGVDDKSTFAFLLTDVTKPFLQRQFIVNRTGNFWRNDGRIIDSLFSDDSVADLQSREVKPATVIKKDSSILDNMIIQSGKRTKLHGIKSKDIVMKKS